MKAAARRESMQINGAERAGASQSTQQLENFGLLDLSSSHFSMARPKRRIGHWEVTMPLAFPVP